MTQDTDNAAVAMLHNMAHMQVEHNAQVHPDWRQQGYEYYRAIWVECAEMLDHFGWKWWKKQAADIDQVKLELVDIWHFALSELIRADRLEDNIGPRLAGLTLAAEPQPEAFRQAIEKLALSTLRTRSFELEPFAAAMQNLPMSYGELHDLYIGKNVLNRFRQDHGYKTGTYQKSWQGREDNEHLVELLGVVRGDSSIPLAEVPQQLYQALKGRYEKLTAA